MGLDVTLRNEEGEELYWANITHNLAIMAKRAGIYEALWHPEQIKATKASDIIDIVDEGLQKMRVDPHYYEQFNSHNGWGLYEHFVPWIEKYLQALKENPDALIEVSV